jgi:hypothetical protein
VGLYTGVCSRERTGHHQLIENLNPKFPLRAFFGHHKCATGWIDTILMELCYSMGLRMRIVHLPRDFASHSSLADFVAENEIEFLSYTNADVRYMEGLKPFRSFHVVRDPRDIVVSAYFSHKDVHGLYPEIVEHRKRLKSLSKDEGLFAEIDFSAKEFRELDRWDYTRPDVFEARMEDLTARPLAEFERIFRFLEVIDDESEPARFVTRTLLSANRLAYRSRHVIPGLSRYAVKPLDKIPMSLLEDTLEKFSFRRLAGGRPKGREDRSSHYRKGVAGDWANHFLPEHKTYFKDHYGDLLIKLGYEEDYEW